MRNVKRKARPQTPGQTPDTVIIVFEDSGIGISNEAQARIMEPFYTTKSVGHGMGLGLSIAFGIVQKHGGTLTFNSLLGEGSCFTIQLPLRASHCTNVALTSRA